MKKNGLFGILALVFALAMTSCSNDPGGNSGTQPAQPPASQAGAPGGVWVAANGSLEIEAPVNIFNQVNGTVQATSVFNGSAVFVESYYSDINVGTVNGENLSVTVPKPTGAMLENVEDIFEPELIESGIGTKVFLVESFDIASGSLWLYDNTQIGANGSDYEIVSEEIVFYIYSEGDVTLSGTYLWHVKTRYVDAKLVQGWNAIVLIPSHGDDDEYIISKNPSSNAKWIVD